MSYAILVRCDVPNRAGRTVALPQGLLYVSEYVQRNTLHQTSIIDTVVTPEWRSQLHSSMRCRPSFVGISSMSGSALTVAMQVARFVREEGKGVPVVWGGVHASLCHESTIASDLCDAVVIGEGERPTLALIESGVLQGAKLCESAFVPLDEIGPLPYQLLRLDQYGVRGPGAVFPYHSSRGCPFHCTFCADTTYHKSRYRFQSPEKVIDSVARIVSEYHPSTIQFTDDEFFIRPERATAICDLWRKHKYLRNVHWVANCRFDYMAKQPVDWWRMVKASGCKRIMAGAECGNDRMLAKVRKQVTVAQMRTGADHVTAAGLELNPLSWVYGFPSETMGDLHDRLNLMDRLENIGHRNRCRVVNAGLFGLALYPGTEVTKEAETLGAKVPRTLEEWAATFGTSNRFPWLTDEYARFGQVASAIIRLRYFVSLSSFGRIRNPWARAAALALQWPLRLSAAIRWPRRWFWCPLEWKAWEWACKKFLGTV